MDGNEENESHAPETFNLPILPQYAAYYKMNPDFAGWLRLKNTKINYPVMLTPDEPEFYLKRAFDRSSSISGTPFIGVGCDTDSDCIIIHGHNMKNDTLFGTLDYYKDKSFWKKNPTVFFDTLYEKREYAILAVFRTRIFKPGESGFRYYEYGGDLSEAEYNKFIKQVSNLALYNTGVTTRYGEPLLVLSTCSYHVDNGRFVVVAKLINQD